MSRADNSDRQFLTLKPEDVGTAVDGKPEKFPFKKLNEILLKLQNRVFSVEGRTQPTVLRNHVSVLAPPADPSLPPANSSLATLFFNDSLSVLKAAEPSASSFSDVLNRIGMWTTDKDTNPDAAVEWAAEVVGSTPFKWASNTTSIDISEPGTYLILTRFSLYSPNGGVSAAELTTTSGEFSQLAVLYFGVATDTFSPVTHLYVWEKVNDVSDGIRVNFSADDPGGVINNSTVPGVLVILKVR